MRKYLLTALEYLIYLQVLFGIVALMICFITLIGAPDFYLFAFGAFLSGLSLLMSAIVLNALHDIALSLRAIARLQRIKANS
jgi:hypothetical protein